MCSTCIWELRDAILFLTRRLQLGLQDASDLSDIARVVRRQRQDKQRFDKSGYVRAQPGLKIDPGPSSYNQNPHPDQASKMKMKMTRDSDTDSDSDCDSDEDVDLASNSRDPFQWLQDVAVPVKERTRRIDFFSADEEKKRDSGPIAIASSSNPTGRSTAPASPPTSPEQSQEAKGMNSSEGVSNSTGRFESIKNTAVKVEERKAGISLSGRVEWDPYAIASTSNPNGRSTAVVSPAASQEQSQEASDSNRNEKTSNPAGGFTADLPAAASEEKKSRSKSFIQQCSSSSSMFTCRSDSLAARSVSQEQTEEASDHDQDSGGHSSGGDSIKSTGRWKAVDTQAGVSDSHTSESGSNSTRISTAVEIGNMIMSLEIMTLAPALQH